MTKIYLSIVLGVFIIFPESALAMHISEGILPMRWAGLWYLAALPFLAAALWRLNKKLKVDPGFKVLLGLMAALIFIISCMPVPVPTAGTCSHPAGTGISAILIGPLFSILVTSIALMIQALFLAHGGITTWGADIVSMGIAGSFAAWMVFKLLRRLKVPWFWCGFMAGLLADWATYLTTSFELASGLHGTTPLWPLFWKVLLAFIPTQLPLGILEGFLTGGMIVFVVKRRPDILASLSLKLGAFLCCLWLMGATNLAFAENKWSGVDETVVEKVAEEHGRSAWRPFINTDQGDLLLFVFLLSGTAGGFVMGYCWRRIFVEQKGRKQ